MNKKLTPKKIIQTFKIITSTFERLRIALEATSTCLKELDARVKLLEPKPETNKD